MKIVTYVSDDAPPTATHMARFLVGKSFLPIIFAGRTAEGVRAEAQTWWDTETAKKVKAPMETRFGKPQPVPPEDKPVPRDEEWSTELEIAAAAGMLEPDDVDPLDDLLG